MYTSIQCRLRRLLRVMNILLAWSVFASTLARADDWGCRVLLCLTNSGGPEQYSQCAPPIEKLWSALRHGDPFPACDFGSGGSQGTGAANTFASGDYCREDLLYWGGPERSELLCHAAGAIYVQINGRLTTRVWWAPPSGTITEYYGAGSTQPLYDPSEVGRAFIREQQREEDQGVGGGA